MGFERGMEDNGEVREVQLQYNGDHSQSQPADCGTPAVAMSGNGGRSFDLGRTVEKKGKTASFVLQMARERSTRTRFARTQPVDPTLTVILLLTTVNLLKNCGEITVSIKSNPSAPRSYSLFHGDRLFRVWR